MPADFKHRSLPLGDLEIPAPGVVDLWFLDFVRLGNPLQGEHPTHPPELNARQSRALRRFYLRLLLGSYLGMPGKDIEISRLVKGKPVLTGKAGEAGVDFSNANSKGCCLVGISGEGHIGVDLEILSRKAGDPLRLARRYFCPAEAEAIAALGSKLVDEAFLYTWACKEAMVKAAGHGIANQLNRFTMSCDPREEPRILSMQDDDPDRWSIALVRPSDAHIGAVALRQPGIVIRCFALGAPSSG